MQLRPYQKRTITDLRRWWSQHSGNPLVTVPTGGGKSVIIAELVRTLFDEQPEQHPRTVVIVPSKELAEQNAEKLAAMLPPHIRVGFYSASLGRREHDADVIVATIGSIYKAAHRLGNIRCVVIDEAHLVNIDGDQVGRYRQFLTDLARHCQFRVVGYTATPFRGNGVFLTDGESPLFDGVASHVSIGELLQAGYLARMILPKDVQTCIDTSGIPTLKGDYHISQLSARASAYLEAAADEACQLAVDRKKWLAFCVSVANAQQMAALLQARGITSAVVTGDTPKAQRETTVAQYRAGQIRCLVTVLALTTGFDVPDVDCLLWLRPTRSPVLYVQGAGRGLRPAPGKADCLWLDFSDTTERMGPLNTIVGGPRLLRSARGGSKVTKLCTICGDRVATAALVCNTCGHEFLTDHESRHASNAEILLLPKIKQTDIAKELKISKAMVTKLKYKGMPVDSIKSALLWYKNNVAATPGTPRLMDGKSHGTKTLIAKELKISKSMVTKLKYKGMPVDSIKSALLWYKNNVAATPGRPRLMNGKSHGTQTLIAKELKISKAMVTKLKYKGMPVDSIKSALLWYKNNVAATPGRPRLMNV